MLKTTVIGNYPKLPSEKGQVNIRKTLHRLDKKEITRADLEVAFDEVTARVVGEQVSAGIDLPTDGQIRWDDIVTPFASKLEGFQIGGLLRWFDNNVYYRKPKIVGAVKWREAISVRNFQFAQQKAGKPIKAVLPAPYSFAKLCDDAHYNNDAKLFADLAALLREEAKALITAGATHIQFDDPCLPYSPQDVGAAVSALNSVVDGLKAEFWTAYYFSNLEKIAGGLGGLKVKYVAADCVSHPSNLETLFQLSGKFQCCFGIVDARNVKMESDGQMAGLLKKIAARCLDAFISPSCGLEFLPHREALAKLHLLAGAVSAFNGGRVNA